MPNPMFYREAPLPRPRPFGLFSVAPPSQLGDGGWKAGVEWETSACGVNVNYADALCAPAGTNEVQTATITGTPTGGTYTLTFDGQSTTALPRTSTNAQIQAALEVLPNVDPGDITVTGTYPGPFTFTFGGQYASRNVSQITATHTFTGGTTPGITMATTVPGVRTPKVLYEDDETNPSALPFTVYVIRECRPVGDWQRAQSTAMKMLAAAEERGVEKELWTRMFAAGAGAVDLTGTLATPEVSLAILEESIRDRYDGAAVIHMSTNLASILATRNAIERHGNHMETQIGNWVVVGAGYPRTGPSGAVPAAGSEWMVATGTVFVDRGTADVKGPFLVQSPLDNTTTVMAERTYVAGWDCTPAAIRATFP
jgi:hypothetical protein